MGWFVLQLCESIMSWMEPKVPEDVKFNEGCFWDPQFKVALLY